MDSFGTNELILSISSDDNAMSIKDDDSPKRIVPKVYENMMIQEEEERDEKEDWDMHELQKKADNNNHENLREKETEFDNSEAGFSANSKKLLQLLR